jgi:hypothetical protein
MARSVTQASGGCPLWWFVSGASTLAVLFGNSLCELLLVSQIHSLAK